MIKLYGSYTSPYVRHCRIALMEAGLSFELIPTDQSQSAEQVATQRVPFFDDGKIKLSDSMSILRYIREQAGQSFLPSVASLEQYCLVNTALDAAANVFYLEKFGLKGSDNAYIERQQARIHSCLSLIEAQAPSFKPQDDVSLRLACFLDWAKFRQRIDHSLYPNLQKLLNSAQSYDAFAQTPPTE